MKLTQARTKELLAKAGAILEGHFVGTSGKHLSVYVAKDRATRLTSIASELCEGIAELFAGDDIDVVVSPAVGGIALSQWTANHLTRLRPDRPEVLALYSEHGERFIMEASKSEIHIDLPEGTFDRENDDDRITLLLKEQLIVKKPAFVLKRGFSDDVRGKRVLEVEDILTTGGSARGTRDAIIQAEGILVGLAVLANGGKVTSADCGVDRLEALMEVERQIFTEEECAAHGLCAKGVPINTDFGHGKQFLEKKK
jgi:orotate phosphoribosyltransferase